MNIKHLFFLVLFVFVLTVENAIALDSIDAIEVSYGWEPSYTYYYDTASITDGKTEGTYETILEVLSRNKDFFTIAVRVPKLSEYILFVKVNRHGLVESAKVAGDFVFPKSIEEEKAHSFLVKALSTLNFFSEEVWLFPPVAMKKGTLVNFHNQRFLFQGLSPNNGNAIHFEIKKYSPASEDETERHLRLFDFKKYLLIEDRWFMEDSVIIFKLNRIEAIGTKEINVRKNDLERGIDADSFRMKICKPFLMSQNKVIKRTAYLGLYEMRDQNLCRIAYFEFVEASRNDEYFQQLTDSFLFDNVRKGENWAVEVLLAEIKSGLEKGNFQDDMRLSMLENLSGLEMGAAQDKWIMWFNRVRDVLPKLRGTETKELKMYLNHKDPWVRLFVLKELSIRKDIDLRPILEKANTDQDEAVREFSIRTFKQIK